MSRRMKDLLATAIFAWAALGVLFLAALWATRYIILIILIVYIMTRGH